MGTNLQAGDSKLGTDTIIRKIWEVAASECDGNTANLIAAGQIAKCLERRSDNYLLVDISASSDSTFLSPISVMENIKTCTLVADIDSKTWFCHYIENPDVLRELLPTACLYGTDITTIVSRDSVYTGPSDVDKDTWNSWLFNIPNAFIFIYIHGLQWGYSSSSNDA